MRTFTSLEMSIAMDRYYEVVGSDFDREPDFWNWLAVNWDEALIKAHKKDPIQFECNLSDDSGLKVDLLLSPHYQTLFKAYQIKHGKDHGNRSRMGQS